MNDKTILIEEIERIVIFCLQKLRQNDKYLLDKNVNERSITHKLAEYLQNEFPMFKVDCEYNRFEDLVKRIKVPKDNVNWDDIEAKTVFPDIIVHKRGTQKRNLLVIEVKKLSSKISGNFDRNKLKAFTSDPYNYKIGLFLKIDTNEEDDNFEWFSKGDGL